MEGRVRVRVTVRVRVKLGLTIRHSMIKHAKRQTTEAEDKAVMVH